ITSLVTPEIDKPENHSIGAGYGARAFWPTLADGKPFLFHCVATDERGKEAHFDTPLIFIDEGLFTASGAKPADVVATAKTAWDSHFGPDNAPVDPDWHNQQVTLAPTATPGDTTFAVTTMGFTGELAAGDEPPFRPRVRRAAVVVPAVQNLTGKPDPVPVRYFGPYVASGFGATNPGEVFLERVSEQDAVAVDFGGAADRGGGLVKPNFDITAISRTKGPSGGAASSAATGGFDPLAFFGSGGGPLLFGVFSLADVVSGVAPTFVSEALTAFQAFATDAARLADLVQQAAASAGAAAADVTSLTAAEGAVTAAVAKVQAALDAAAQDPAQAAADLAGATASVTGTLDALNAAAGGLPLPVALAADLAGRVSVLRQLLTGGPLGDAMTALQHGAGLVDSLRRVRLEWSPKMSSFPNDPDMWIFGADAQTKFTLAVELRRNAGPDGKEAPPGVDISCALENFKVRLVPPLSMMVLHFDRVAFRSHDGKKPDVDVKFADNGVEFVGILSFVQTLKSLIPLDGFSDPPNIEVGSDGVKAGFSLGLPNLAIGVFSLENMSLGADFKVPFIGDPVSAGFNFCTRERPFTLTVSMLGGGGFFGIRVSPKGVMLLEAAIEFGAALSVDLGVASGSVSIMAGIYFKMENDACSLTGYFRLRGEVEVLGLISASIELYLGLTYEFSSGKMTGTATISVEVEVLCFSTTAHISVEKKFAGANGDPTLAELFDPSGTGGPGSPWFDYCEAFAEV
ncbi:MAG: hypothetical protein QOG64_3035, partial [Acidimicrobiaceae bacterium]|nr:hypothetical protein [Acidimicrobiaceae bacterium]